MTDDALGKHPKRPQPPRTFARAFELRTGDTHAPGADMPAAGADMPAPAADSLASGADMPAPGADMPAPAADRLAAAANTLVWLRAQANARKLDRKSTRLNSSHLVISYAVFCLKKKRQYAHQQ